MKVKTIAEFNPSPSAQIQSRNTIDYIDTASVVEGRLCEVQHLVNIFPSRAQREIHSCDILISSVRPNLKHNYFVEDGANGMIVSSGFIHIRVKNPLVISPRFLYYYLTGPAQVQHYVKIADSSQSAYPSFNKDVIENIDLPEINLPAQLRIAGVLGSIDEKIELNRKKIAELEALAKTIYDYWFVQFDFPDKNGKPYKSSGGKMVWNEQLKREVPVGWEVGELSNICTISTAQCNPARFPQDAIEHYSIPAFDAGIFPAFDAPQSILSNKFRVVKTAILYSKLNAQFKRIWDPLHITNNPVASSEFVVYVPKNALHRGYLYAVLNGEQFFAFANSISSCSTGSRKRFTPETTYHFSIVLPHSTIVEEFSRQYSVLLNSMRTARLEIDFLTRQRDTLLPLLMNGQVEVAG